MIISFVYPYELTSTPIFVDTEKDFEKISVNTIGYADSNKFLVSLWNQVNIRICPNHCVDRAPWAYFPGKFTGKKISVSVLGFCQTSIGELYFALEYKKKGDIDSLLVMRLTSKLQDKDIQLLKTLVNDARINIDHTMRFLCRSKILMKLKGVHFTEYYAKNFCIIPCKDGIEFGFYVNAVDKFEAEQQALERLYEICAFLSVETNIYCSFEEFSINSNEVISQTRILSPFVDDYIDNYPAIKRWQICISSYAFKFISQNILSLERFEKRNEVERCFISACKHVQIGIENELQLGDMVIANIPFGTLALAKRDQRRKIEHMTSALMSYLSAVECATVTESGHETCKVCGAIKYKIADRVRNLSTEFLGEHLGQVFHKLYAYRSKFLHTGRMASDANSVRTIPLLSESSQTGVKEYGNVTVSVDGKTISCNVVNIREWTTYMLRCYYQKRILGRTSFSNVFEDRREITHEDFPLIINAVSPEGAEHMKMFVRTDSLVYKFRAFLQIVVVKIKRIVYKFLCKFSGK